MTIAANRLLSAALDLSEEERVELAAQLLASVEEPNDAAWSDAWLAELDRRTAAGRQPPALKAEWSAARVRLLERLPRS